MDKVPPNRIEKLILLVKDRPSVYDYSMKDHSNKQFIDNVWTGIGRAMGIEGKYLKIITTEHLYTFIRTFYECILG